MPGRWCASTLWPVWCPPTTTDFRLSHTCRCFDSVWHKTSAVERGRLLMRLSAKALIGDHEPAYADQWRALDGDYARRMLAGIVAFELRVTDLQCALKLNQHRKEAHAAMHAAYRKGGAQAQALAGWMQRLGMVPATDNDNDNDNDNDKEF